MGAFDVKVVQTGSAGNCCIIDSNIMVDCGLSKARIGRYLKSQVDRIFITHEHGDHLNIGVLNWLAKERPLLVSHGLYVNESTFKKIMAKAPEVATLISQENIISSGDKFQVKTRSGVYVIETFACFHDVENLGFIIRNENGESLVYMTDTVSSANCPDERFDCICCEGNYDEEAVKDALSSEDRGISFRAQMNLRHLSVQQFEAFAKSHSKPDTQIYQLHESDTFGIESGLNGLNWLETWNEEDKRLEKSNNAT